MYKKGYREVWEDIKKASECFVSEHFEELFGDIIHKKKRKRTVYEAHDLNKSNWGILLRDPDLKDPNSRKSLLFRRRFRVPPHIFFEVLVPLCHNRKIFGDPDKGRRRISIELKLLVALRILGRGCYADDCSELSGIPESTCNFIFHQFVKNFSFHYQHKFIRFQVSNDELLRTMEVYRQLGLPGCIGSIDCTHIRLDKCPKDLKFECTGKEGYPTLSFQVVVNHSRLITHCSNAFMGSYNDMTISRNDPIITRFMNGQLYNDIPYQLYNTNSELETNFGVYLLSDNGYLQKSTFIRPMKSPSTREESIWSEWIESVRKDVECLFGVIKSRFRFLKNPIQYHNLYTIEGAFKTSCILHNILLIYDQKEYEYNSFDTWDTLCPDGNDTENDIPVSYNTMVNDDSNANNSDEVHMNNQQLNRSSTGRHFSPDDYITKRNALVRHLSIQYQRNELRFIFSNKLYSCCIGG